MPPKAPRRTGERILETALAMFNQFGKPTVTTPSIAFEMGISPGNLHYHYHSKEAIVADLCRVPARDRDDACRAGSAPSQRRGRALSPPRVRGDLEISLHLSRHQPSRRPLSCDRGAVPPHPRPQDQSRGTDSGRPPDAGAEYRPGGELLDVVRVRARPEGDTRRQDARPRDFVAWRLRSA